MNDPLREYRERRDLDAYRNLTTDDQGEEVAVSDAVERGFREVWLEGEEVRGGYAFIHSRTGGDPANWLLTKIDDDAADARRNPVSTRPESVLSGRTVDDVADEDDT